MNVERPADAAAGSRGAGRMLAPVARPGAAIVGVTLGSMLAPLNSTMIAVALPRIAAEFGASVATVGWLVIAYLVAMAGVQPAAGTLGDLLGRRRLVLGGLAVFGAASLCAALAPTLPLLILARTCQAVAGAVLIPNGTALVREIVPQAERARRFGQIGAAISCAAAIGPPLGGVLVGTAGWRAVFAANIALIAPALWLGLRALPGATTQGAARRFDVGGALLLTGLLGLLAAILSRWQAISAFSPAAAAGLIVALIAGFALFLLREARHPAPALQPRLFLNRGYGAANGANAASNLAMYVTLLATPILLARRGGWDSARVGVLLAFLSGATVLASPLGGRLADRIGRRWPATLGLALLTLGALPLALGGGQVATPALVGGLLLEGLGLGLASAALQTGAIESVSGAQSGAAAGVFSTSRYLGSIVGSSVLAGLLGTEQAGLSGFAAVFVLVTIAAGLAVAASLFLRDWPAQSPAASAAAPGGPGRPGG